MGHEKNCLLREVCRSAGGTTCNKICPYYVSMHGQSGKGGRVAQSNIPLDYSKMTVTYNPVREAQPEVYYQIDAYVKTFSRIFQENGERIRSLYLFSESPGTGKTSTACAIANEYLIYHFIGNIQRGVFPKDKVVYFLDFNYWQSKFNEFNNPRVPAEIADEASSEFYYARNAAKNAEFLVIDDIGIRDPSEAFGAIAHDLINHRVMNRMPTVYTSNVPMRELIRKYDERLWDRIRDNCIEIDFDGESRRGIRKDFDSQ
jgi:DNA replication protein DnaC